jgi:DNA-binding phage protein
MNAVQLAPSIKVEIVEVGHQMKQAHLSEEFIAAAVTTAFEYEGVYDLLKMWSNEDDPKERGEIVADIQELIDDCGQQEKDEGVYVRFDDLDAIAKNIRAFKDNLRALVDQKGGVKHLAALTGIPQPSLSRFFNSATMPRRTTLHKIARALNLSQVEIATQWSK